MITITIIMIIILTVITLTVLHDLNTLLGQGSQYMESWTTMQTTVSTMQQTINKIAEDNAEERKIYTQMEKNAY